MLLSSLIKSIFLIVVAFATSQTLADEGQDRSRESSSFSEGRALAKARRSARFAVQKAKQEAIAQARIAELAIERQRESKSKRQATRLVRQLFSAEERAPATESTAAGSQRSTSR